MDTSRATGTVGRCAEAISDTLLWSRVFVDVKTSWLCAAVDESARAAGARRRNTTGSRMAETMTESVSLSVTDGVALLTLDDRATRNALSTATAEALVDACDAIDRDTAVGAVILSGQNNYFCSGGDRKELAAVARDPYADASQRILTAIYSAFVRVGNLSCPTIAAVQGGAIGAGLNLLLSCDVRVLADDAVLSGFSGLRVHPGGGNLALLLRAGSREAAVAIAALGETASGADWARHGLCWSALPANDVPRQASRLAMRAAQDPTLARAVMSTLRAELGPPPVPWTVAVELERAAQLRSFTHAARSGNPFENGSPTVARG